MSTPAAFRDRIRELRRVPAGQLKAHPANWRRHPKEQAAALRAVLREVGWADAAIAREDEDGQLVLLDGHLRAGLDPKQEIPVLVLDVTEEEGLKILATLDPLAAMAEKDEEAMRALAEQAKLDEETLRDLVNRQIEEEGNVHLAPKVITTPPVMSWILVGIPTIRFGEIAEVVEKLTSVDDIFCEIVVGDADSMKLRP
jgi:hypothetical protein